MDIKEPKAKRVHWDAELEALWDAEMETLSGELAEKRWAREMEIRRARAREERPKEKEPETDEEAEQEKEDIEEPSSSFWSLSEAMEIGSSILALMEQRTTLLEEITLIEETLKKKDKEITLIEEKKKD